MKSELGFNDVYKELLLIVYYPDTNEFYDSCGFPIINIFEFITPNDLYLFRHGHQYMFPHRKHKGILCEFDMEEEYHDGYLAKN